MRRRRNLRFLVFLGAAAFVPVLGGNAAVPEPLQVGALATLAILTFRHC